MIPLNALPDIGEHILVRTGATWSPATIISMHECRARSPELWHPRGWNCSDKDHNSEPRAYAPDDTIRAYCFTPSDGESHASFMIMRFGPPGRYEYNKNVCVGTLDIINNEGPIP